MLEWESHRTDSTVPLTKLDILDDEFVREEIARRNAAYKEALASYGGQVANTAIMRRAVAYEK